MANKNQYGLPSRVLSKICAIFRKWPAITRVVLYGSRAMGNYRKGSDIDLCIEAEDFTLTQLLRVATQIDDLLLPWKVDLVIKNRIDHEGLLEHINSVGIEVYLRKN